MKHARPFPLAALSVLGLAVLTASLGAGADIPAPGERWPAWRGVDGQGIADGARVPLEWSATKNVLWKTALPGRGLSSPVVRGERIFLLTDRGRLSCLDARTGEVRYEGGRLGASFMASPVAVDGHLLLMSEEGDTYVVKAGPAFEIVTENSLGESVGASPAVVGGRIYIRGEKHLFAIGAAPAS